ncbi:unnamed protein product [Blepharisma stoltei]|uniref:Uncharacterized protein n=1 Tax=Blepharisma stoltei TaxID=1481888 RepID=A0AAU9J7X8_9CILI|nr:unnamed protein product [Blepharisma stoltei]
MAATSTFLSRHIVSFGFTIGFAAGFPLTWFLPEKFYQKILPYFTVRFIEAKITYEPPKKKAKAPDDVLDTNLDEILDRLEYVDEHDEEWDNYVELQEKVVQMISDKDEKWILLKQKKSSGHEGSTKYDDYEAFKRIQQKMKEDEVKRRRERASKRNTDEKPIENKK